MINDENEGEKNKILEFVEDGTEAAKKIANSKALANPINELFSPIARLYGEELAGWARNKQRAKKKEQEDKAKVKSTISAALSEEATKLAINDGDLVERAANSWASKQLRSQMNKESVARLTYEELVENPPEEEASEQVDDDWMNQFEAQAENVSSEKLQQTYAKILAGEIRTPGLISRQTLQFLTILDQETANAFEELMPFIVGGNLIIDDFTKLLPYSVTQTIKHAGIAPLSIPGDTRKFATCDKDGRTGIVLGSQLLILEGQIDQEVSIVGTELSLVGKQLFSLLETKNSKKALGALINYLQKKTPIKKVFEASQNEDASLVKGKLLWERSE